MKFGPWVAIIGFGIVIYGCGKVNRPVETQPEPQQETPIENNRDDILVLPVRGSAAFGSQCPDGSFVPPQPATIELYQCPLKLQTVELAENLQPITLQADCKKRIMDVRGIDRTKTTSWEFMPNGAFDIVIDAGTAKLKDDGEGNQNCEVPLVANLMGHVDCTDMLKAKIYLDTVWWLDKSLPISSPLPSIGPSGLPSSLPSGLPSGLPSTIPSITPSAFPIVSPSPSPSSTRRLINFEMYVNTPSPRPGISPLPSQTARKCQLPQTKCYFYKGLTIDQCS
jgi:hypothetical protein